MIGPGYVTLSNNKKIFILDAGRDRKVDRDGRVDGGTCGSKAKYVSPLPICSV